MEILKSEEQKGKRLTKSKQSLKDLWDMIKRANIHIVGVPEGGEKIFGEIMAKNFINLMKDERI